MTPQSSPQEFNNRRLSLSKLVNTTEWPLVGLLGGPAVRSIDLRPRQNACSVTVIAKELSKAIPFMLC